MIKAKRTVVDLRRTIWRTTEKLQADLFSPCREASIKAAYTAGKKDAFWLFVRFVKRNEADQ